MNEAFTRCSGSGVNIGTNDTAPRFTMCPGCDQWVTVYSDFVNTRIAEHARVSIYQRVVGDHYAPECACGWSAPPQNRNVAHDMVVAHEAEHRKAGIPGTITEAGTVAA